MEHWRLLETLNFIATALHKGFSPLFKKLPPEQREVLVKNILTRLGLLQGKLGDKPHVMGERFSIADAYAFVILNWARKFEIDVSAFPALNASFKRLIARPAIQQTPTEEGLPPS